MSDAHAFIDDALSRLAAGLDERGSDWRNVQLATVSPEGRPGVRTLILRGFDQKEGTAELHSDSRAGKVRDIKFSRHVSILAWSPDDQLQIRMSGKAELHNQDGLARTRWEALSDKARATYGLAAEPGSSVDGPEQSNLTPDRQFEMFTVIVVSLSRADVLRLESGGGQTRAVATFGPGERVAQWVGA
jgi:hypothetical protein